MKDSGSPQSTVAADGATPCEGVELATVHTHESGWPIGGFVAFGTLQLQGPVVAWRAHPDAELIKWPLADNCCAHWHETWRIGAIWVRKNFPLSRASALHHPAVSMPSEAGMATDPDNCIRSEGNAASTDM